MSALLFQVGISAPLLLAVIVYTATRRRQGLVQRYMLWLLVLILAWMLGMVALESNDPQIRHAGTLLIYPPASFMSPLFCLLMLLYARVEIFERSRGARWAVLAPFWLFLLAFVTDGWHGQMLGGIPGEPVGGARSRGAWFWAFQVWSNFAAVVGLGVCGWVAWSSRSRRERRRMGLLCLGATTPLVAHLGYMFQILPFDFPLTPVALGVTSLLIVASIQRYRLLDVQPVARRDVIEASHEAIIIADDEEHVVDLNPVAARLLGEEREQLCGRSFADVLAELEPTEPSGVIPAILEAVRKGETPPVCELQDSTGRILEASIATAVSASGGTAGYFAVLRERTSERRAERLLQHSQRLESVGILAAGVAHEVNNPLAYVRSNLVHLFQLAQTLEERRGELPKEIVDQTQDLGDVIGESLAGLERIQGIVQGMLGLSRSGPRRVEPCDANTLVLEAARFASLGGNESVLLESRLEQDLPPIEAAPDQLVQVLLNLFINARQVLRERPAPRILASTRLGEGCVEIRVADNGPGVPESIRTRIFDPFFTTRPPNEGTGLGLPIAFDIVREHGGTIELEASELGGACFVVRLPVVSGHTVPRGSQAGRS